MDKIAVISFNTNRPLVSHIIRRHGFLIQHIEGKERTIVVFKLSKKLITKLMLGRSSEIPPFTTISEKQNLALLNDALSLLHNTVCLDIHQAWILHDLERTSCMLKKSGDDVLASINEYYGPQFGLYAGFLNFYSLRLYIFASLGLTTFILQCLGWQSQLSSIVLFLLTLLWGTYLAKYWTRTSAVLIHRWKINDIESPGNKTHYITEVSRYL